MFKKRVSVPEYLQKYNLNILLEEGLNALYLNQSENPEDFLVWYPLSS